MGNQIERLFGLTTPQFKSALFNRPYSDQNKVIFPWDHKQRDYSFQEYNPATTINSLAPEQANDVFDSLSRSRYWDPNMDCVSCLILMMSLLLLILLILLPIVIVVSSGSSANLWVWISLVIILALFSILLAYFIYKYQVDREEKRMLKREADFARILSGINSMDFNNRNTSWETGPRGSYLQFNKNRGSTGQVVINSPVKNEGFY